MVKRGRKEKDNLEEETAAGISGKERISLLYFLRGTSNGT